MKPKMRWAILGAVTACLVVGLAEILFHWYAGTGNTPMAKSWNEWYKAPDPDSGRIYHASFVDLIIPVVLLGLAVGFITARQSRAVLVWSVFLLCLCLVALWPFYAVVTPTRDSDEWWRFASNGVRVVALVPGYFKGVSICLACAIFARALGQYYRDSGPPYDL